VNKYLNQGKEWLDDHSLNIYDFHARGYDPAIGRTIQMDPLSDLFFNTSPYSWALNNPISFIDPTGMFSTHTDSTGTVVAIYNDGDNSVYRHDKLPDEYAEYEGQTKNVKDKNGKKSKVELSRLSGGEKMGETEYWDEFRAHDDNTGEILKNIQENATIHFGETWDYIINVKNRTSDQMGLSLTAYGSLPNNQFDVKKSSYFAPNGSATGKLLGKYYASARSAGNYLAGLNGATGKFNGRYITIGTYMRIAGQLHSPFNNSGAPYYGEIPYAGRMIEAGFNAGIRKRK
jgi:RHS repeat-associated protein